MNPPAKDAVKVMEAQDAAITKVLDEVRKERKRQLGKWGEQHHPDFGTPFKTPLHRANAHALQYPASYRDLCEQAAMTNRVTWAHIFLEEVGEVFSSASEDEMYEELIQTIAVAVSWAEDINYRRYHRGRTNEPKEETKDGVSG